VTLSAEVRVALDAFTLDAELHVAAREFVAVVGPNGAGKTTLLRSVAGLLPIDAGRIEISGALVDDAEKVFVPPERRPVGVVFHRGMLFPHLSVLDNVAFGLRERGLPRTEARERSRDWLARVQLAEKAGAKPAQLSGGEAQRVALARALATDPALLLLDEPFAAFDVQHRAEGRRLLGAVVGATDAARVMVTHDPVDALTLADRIVILEAGRVVQSGTPDEIVALPRSAYVADLVGMNVYRADAEGTALRSAGVTFTVPEQHEGAVLAIVAPRAVVLSLERPATTARNVWPGTVRGVERLGDRMRVRVDIGVPVVAEVTAASVAELGLRPGTDVWVAVKATEITTTPAI
jgi:molybdate transport system ATP-binding protein